MIFVDFFKDRKWSPKLKVALEIELARMPVPTKEGKTIREYFGALRDYATRFAIRKVEFIREFEQAHGVVFSVRYRRKYLAHCFDSYCEDLQNIALNLLEIEFAFLINREKASSSDLYDKCLERLSLIIEDYINKPLGRFLEHVLEFDVWDTQRREKFLQVFKDIVETLEKRGRKEVDKFFKKRGNELMSSTSKEAFNRFVEELRASGFQLPSRGYEDW